MHRRGPRLVPKGKLNPSSIVVLSLFYYLYAKVIYLLSLGTYSYYSFPQYLPFFYRYSRTAPGTSWNSIALKMSKTVIPFIAHLVQFNTTLPFADVIARLNMEVNKVALSNTTVVAKISLVKNQQELKSVVEEATGTDFLCERFSSFPLSSKSHLLKPQILHGNSTS